MALRNKLHYLLFLDYTFFPLSSSFAAPPHTVLFCNPPLSQIPSGLQDPLCTASPKKPSRFLLGGSDRSVRSSLGTFLAFCSSFTGLIISFPVSWLFVYSPYLLHQSVSSSGEGTAGPGSPLNPSGADRPGRLHALSAQAGSTELGNAPTAQFLTRNRLDIFPN